MIATEPVGVRVLGSLRATRLFCADPRNQLFCGSAQIYARRRLEIATRSSIRPIDLPRREKLVAGFRFDFDLSGMNDDLTAVLRGIQVEHSPADTDRRNGCLNGKVEWLRVCGRKTKQSLLKFYQAVDL